MGSKPPLHIYVIAGEPSGDALGGRLMAALKQQTEGDVSFSGVGGQEMTEQGLQSLFPMSDLSVMGIAEVLPQIPKLLRRISRVVSDVRSLKPDVVVSIDAPDFSFRVAKRLKNQGIPMVHLVAPTVWAWRPGRAKKVAQFLDHILCLFPFEPKYFERQGLAASFVGHSIIESPARDAKAKTFRAQHGLKPNTPVLALLPGSRMGEVTRHLPVFRDTAEILAAQVPDLSFVCVTTGEVANYVREELARWPIEIQVIEANEEKYDAMASADVALAASGTVALELAVVGTPTVIGYQVNWLTAWIGKRLVTAKFASLVNILLEKEVMPEFLVAKFRAELLAPALFKLLSDPDARLQQTQAFGEAVAMLSPEPGLSPSQKMATAILETIRKKT